MGEYIEGKWERMDKILIQKKGLLVGNHLFFVLCQVLNYIPYVFKMVPFKCTDKGILFPTLL